MFHFFGRAKRARTVAYSIGQLIHMLSRGYESMGPKSAERLLRGLGTDVQDERWGQDRVVRALVPITTDQAMFVSCCIKSTGDQFLMINGNDDYFGFSLTCKLPLRSVVIDLRPGTIHTSMASTPRPVTKQARLLYAACKTMPNVVEAPQ
jgi:hypothetical protein